MPTITTELLLPTLKKGPSFYVAAIENKDEFCAYWSKNTLIDHLKSTHRTLTPTHTSQTINALITAFGHQDLFSDQKFYILQLESNTLLKNKDTDLLLSTCINNKHFLLILLPTKLSPSQSKLPAVNTLKQKGLWIDTKKMYEKQTTTWINHLLQQPCLKTAQHIGQQHQFEPHLIHQTLIKYRLAFPNQKPTAERISAIAKTSSSQEPSIFSFVEAVFTGHSSKVHAIMQTEPPKEWMSQSFWMIIKQLRTLLLHKEQQHPLFSNTTKAVAIAPWGMQKHYFARSTKLPICALMKIYSKLCRIEWVLKGYEKENLSFALSRTYYDLTALFSN